MAMYWMTSDVKAMGMIGAAAGLGLVQTMYLRGNGAFLPSIPMLGKLGQPPVFYNLALGLAAMALGFMGKTQGKFITNSLHQDMAFVYGTTALIGGAWNYFFPGMMAIAAPVAAPSQAFAFAQPAAAEWIMRRLDQGIL